MRSSIERVVEHEVGGAQPRDRRPRQQPGIARAGADQRDMSLHSHESSGPLSHGTRGPRLSEIAATAELEVRPRARRRRIPDRARSARAAAAACAPPSARRRAAMPRARRAPATPTPPDRAAAARRAPRAAARSSAGASPLVEIASVTPSRRTTPLRNAVALAGSSTALTKMRRVSAASATWRLTSGVAAATTSQASSRSAGSNGRRISVDLARRRLRAAGSRRAMSGATTRTRAPAASSCRSLAAATGRRRRAATARPVRFRNNGKS